MSYTTYYGTPSNSFAGISRPTTVPVASGSLAIYTSDTNMADYAASQVPFWDAATAYSTVGQQVLYDNQIWAVVAGSTGVTPGTDPTKWALLGTGGGGGVSEPAYQIVYGTGTGVDSSADFTFDSGTGRLVQVASVTSTNAARRLAVDFNNAMLDLAADVTDVSLTNYGSASMLKKWQTDSMVIRAQIRWDGAASFGVNSSFAWGNGDGSILALGTPTTEPTTSPVTGNMALWFKSSTNRIRTISGTGNTVSDVAYTSDLSSYLPLAGGTMTGHISLYGTASGTQAISYAQVSAMVKGAVAQVGYYRTDTTLTTTPGAEKMTWNNSTQISSTTIYINIVDQTTDLFVFYEQVAVGDTILIQDRNDSDNYQTWKVTATPTYASSVFTFPVTLVNSGGTGTTNFPNNHEIFIYTNRAAVPVNTDQLPEGTTNLYFTQARVLATPLTGFSASTNTAIVATDTVLQAFQKAQAQITDRLSSALTSAYLFVGNGSNVATGVAMSGDATLANTGALTLANTTVSAASYGSASSVATFTVDSKGRLTAASNTAISIASSAVSGLVKGATSNQIIKGNAAGSYAALTGNYSLATTDANAYLLIGAGTFTVTIPCDTLGAALEANSLMMIPWRKIGSGTTTFAVSGAGAGLTILGGGTLGTALTGAAGVICIESTTLATITGTL